ncbi:hypothetical protein [Streptomyces sp. NPDC088146]|uniref:hypothetical protein n=1 Tax=Streptomyces sp. NPDC088146 TaxID=3365829 RepID=UPI00382D6A00
MRHKFFTAGIAALAGTFVVLGLTGIGNSAAAEAADTPPVAVEDFAYPSADKILAEQGILLKSGDGHITLADCASETGLLEVLSRDNDKFCFKVTGTTGYLALELAKVYGVKGNDYTVQIDMTVDNSEVSYDIGKNTWTQVGEAADPTKRPHTLMEIRATK